MKILLTADLHLGRESGFWDDDRCMYSESAVSFLALEKMVDVFLDNSADVFVLGGDIFDTGLPTPNTVSFVLEQLGRVTDSGGKVIAISGNHEHIKLNHGQKDPIEVFLPMAGALVATEATVVNIDGVSFALLPWHRFDSKEFVDSQKAISDDVDKLISEFTGEGILIGHCLLDDMDFGVKSVSRDPIISVEQLCSGPWLHSFLGHVHKREFFQGQDVHYIGSPYQITLKEAGEVKGCDLVTLEDGVFDIEFIPIDVRDIVKLNFDNDNSVLDKLVLSKYDIIRIELTSEQNVNREILDEISKLKEKAKLVSADVKINVLSEKVESVVGAKDTTITVEDDTVVALKKWLIESGYGNEDIPAFIDLAKEVFE